VIIDSHVHVACPDEGRFPRQPSPGVGSAWYRTGGSPASLLDELDGQGVARAVVVQAIGLYGYDCRCAVDAATAQPGRFGLVGTVDLDGPDPVAALAELAEGAPAMRGVRLFGVGMASPAWLDDGRGPALWEAAGDLGLVVVPTILADRVPDLRRSIEAFPAVPVALDHCGFPHVNDPHGLDALVALADLPSLTVKVTSHVLEEADEAGDPAAVVDRLAEAFGPERLAWGSDFPQNPNLSYPEMVALARRAVRNLDPDGREQVLAGTSLALWWPGETAG
jgi:L-fuconolactonase